VNKCGRQTANERNVLWS